MKAKLIKEGSFGYKIKFYNDDDTAACALGLLSLKNCQAIERGYDLDELGDEYYKQFDNLPVIRYNAYTAGFQKALEILGDKKFSEDDMKRAFNKGAFYGSTGLGNTHYFDGILESLQQTEWDVEVEMECLDKNCDGINRKGCCIPGDKPKIDSEGYLILKRL